MYSAFMAFLKLGLRTKTEYERTAYLRAYHNPWGSTIGKIRVASDNLTVLASEAVIGLLLQSRRPRLSQIKRIGLAKLPSDPQYVHITPAGDEFRMSKAALNMMTIQMHNRLKEQNVCAFAVMLAIPWTREKQSWRLQSDREMNMLADFSTEMDVSLGSH
jgi:NAD(P)-dependent dehydrogenase (short-subunit alcohol dehydrogenase family)